MTTSHQPHMHHHPEGPDIRTMLHLVTSKLWLIIMVVMACVIAAAGYIKMAPRLYSATATIQVEQLAQSIVIDKNAPQEDLRNVEMLKTIVETLKARSILERVADTNNLAGDPRFLVPGPGGPPTRAQVVSALEKMVKVALRRGTRLIDVTVVHSVPEFTHKIANSIIQEFMNQNTEQHASTREVASEFLIQEASRLAKKLQDSEKALQTYRKDTGTVSLDQRQDTIVTKLKELSTRVTEAEAARIRVETDYDQAKKLGNNFEALLILPVVANDRNVLEAQGTVNKLESALVNIRQRYKPKHPKYTEAMSQIQEWRITFTNVVLALPGSLKSIVESARNSEEAIRTSLRAQEVIAMNLNESTIGYNVLLREVETDRALYESVLNQMKQTTVTKDAQPTKYIIVQQAYRPESPFSPKSRIILAAGFLAGLLLSAMLIMALNALDQTFKTVDQVESHLQLPVLGAIPTMREVRKSRSHLVVSHDPQAAGAESFRTLRTSLSMLGRVDERRSFLFTSALPAEGKTLISLNFAACLAQQGLRTLIIDGDLRRPSVENYLTALPTNASPEGGTPRSAGPAPANPGLNEKSQRHLGVTDYLTGKKEFNDLVQPSGMENLFYVPAGSTAPNPAELIAQGGFAALIKEALNRFDRVVVDSAPVHAVSDTLLFAGSLQTVCVVARVGKAPRRAVIRTINLLRKAGAAPSGIILNRLPRRRSRGYGYQYDAYYDYAYAGKYAEKGVYGAK